MSRIYSIDDVVTKEVALVRAGNPAQAIRHHTRKRFVAKVASQEELVKLLSTGAEVETAGEESDPPSAPPAGDPPIDPPSENASGTITGTESERVQAAA